MEVKTAATDEAAKILESSFNDVEAKCRGERDQLEVLINNYKK